MAKKRISPLQSLMEGFALGSGIPMGMLPSVRDEQEAARARKRLPELFPPEIPVGTGPDVSEELALLGQQPPDVLPTAEERASAYKREDLDPEGQKSLARVNAISAAKRGKRPDAQAELERQAQEELDRADLDSHVIQPPTIQEQAELRVTEHPNGVVDVMQPDGRLDLARDRTSKADLKRMELESKERTQIQQMQEQQRESRRQQRMAKEEERKRVTQEAEMKAKEDRTQRFRDHWSKTIEEKPMSERYAAAKKSLEDSYKRLNPDRPAKRFSPSEIQNFAHARIAMDFRAAEVARAPVDPFDLPRKLSPKEALRKRFEDDREGFQDDYEDARNRLLLDNDEVTPQMVLDAMLESSPEMLESEIDAWIEQDRRPTTEPVAQPGVDLAEAVPPTDEQIATAGDLLGLRAGPAAEDMIPSPSDIPPIGPDRTSQKQARKTQLAEELGVDESEVPPKEIERPFVVVDLLKKDTPKKKAQRANDRKKGKRFIQDMLPADQEEIAALAMPVMDEDDYEALSPGQLGIDADTGQIITRPIRTERAEQLRQFNRGTAISPIKTNIPIVASQKQYDKLKDGEIYMDESTGAYTVKKGKKFKRPKTVADVISSYDPGIRSLLRQTKATLLGN